MVKTSNEALKKHSSPVFGRSLTSIPTFSALANRDFRLMWSSNVLSYNARWMQMFILTLFVLERTGSPFFVALVGFFGMVSMLVLGLFGGLLADKVSRKHLLIATQTANFVAGLAIMILLFAEIGLAYRFLPFWFAYVVLLVAGTGWALDMPSRRSIVFDLLGKEQVTKGIATDSIGMHSSMMLGPILAGVLTSSIGFSGGYLVITAFYFVSVVLMALVRVPLKSKSTIERSDITRNLMEGFKYVRQNETILATVLITILMNVLLFPYQQMVPIIATTVLRIEPWQIGFLMGAQGVGSLAGGIMIASASNIRNQGRIYLYGSLLALSMVLLFSFSNWYSLSLSLLIILGLGSAGFGTMQSTIIILAAKDEMRSRVLGVLTFAIGTGPIGALIVGSVAESIGPQNAIAINAIVGLLTVGLVGFLFSSLRKEITEDSPSEGEPASTPPNQSPVEVQTSPR